MKLYDSHFPTPKKTFVIYDAIFDVLYCTMNYGIYMLYILGKYSGKVSPLLYYWPNSLGFLIYGVRRSSWSCRAGWQSPPTGLQRLEVPRLQPFPR